MCVYVCVCVCVCVCVILSIPVCWHSSVYWLCNSELLDELRAVGSCGMRLSKSAYWTDCPNQHIGKTIEISILDRLSKSAY